MNYNLLINSVKFNFVCLLCTALLFIIFHRFILFAFIYLMFSALPGTKGEKGKQFSLHISLNHITSSNVSPYDDLMT
jgi:hypothetical protein